MVDRIEQIQAKDKTDLFPNPEGAARKDPPAPNRNTKSISSQISPRRGEGHNKTAALSCLPPATWGLSVHSGLPQSGQAGKHRTEIYVAPGCNVDGSPVCAVITPSKPQTRISALTQSVPEVANIVRETPMERLPDIEIRITAVRRRRLEYSRHIC
jgi:hypothetical protein